MIFKLAPSSVMTGDRSASISHTLLRLHFSVMKYTFFRKIVVHRQSVLFAVHLLKILNTIFCTPQVLLLYVKSCTIIRKYIALCFRWEKNWLVFKRYLSWWFWHYCYVFSVCSIIYFLVQPFLLTSYPLCACMFCSIVTCDMHCKQQKLSRWALLVLGKNVVINIV